MTTDVIVLTRIIMAGVIVQADGFVHRHRALVHLNGDGVSAELVLYAESHRRDVLLPDLLYVQRGADLVVF